MMLNLTRISHLFGEIGVKRYKNVCLSIISWTRALEQDHWTIFGLTKFLRSENFYTCLMKTTRKNPLLRLVQKYIFRLRNIMFFNIVK